MLEKILFSEEFLKDKITYSIVDLILKSETPEYITDGGNYLICRSSLYTPIWIWTKDDINNEKIKEVLIKLDKWIDISRTIQITSKKVIFDKLTKIYKNILIDNYFMQKGYYLNMIAYKCDKPILVKEKIGHKERPTYDDLELLTYFQKCDIEDTIREEYSKQIKLEKLIETAKSHIDNPNFYVWKVDGRIVATGGYIDNRVSMVFTNREDRGKGYAGMLCYELCTELINQGKTPMLYADADYIASNRAYQKIGFTAVGDVYNLKIGNKKVRELKR